MESSNTAATIILYHYPFSPYARRVSWYLRLRGIPYLECIQPPILPRPDLSNQLGISYRRIPVLSHGRDVYLDTRLILSHLESSPSLIAAGYAPLGCCSSSSSSSSDALAGDGGSDGANAKAANPESKALESLLSVLTTQTDLFFRAADLLPPSLPLLKDPKFLADRRDFFPPPTPSSSDSGSSSSEQAAAAAAAKENWILRRAEALTAIRDAISLLETTILSDGRRWVLKNGNDKTESDDGPTLADIEAVWPLHWLLSAKQGINGSIYDDEVVNATKYPKVFAWVQRFEDHVCSTRDPRQGKASGEEAARNCIMAVAPTDDDKKYEVDQTEPVVKALGLKGGDEIQVWPTDSGSGHKDRGRLVGINEREVVWVTEKGVRVHAPRRGFRVVKVKVGGGGVDGGEDKGKL